MENILEIDSEKFRILSDMVLSQEQLDEIRKQLTKGCCNNVNILKLATGCGVTKYKGQTVTLTGTASGGTGTLHYNWIITKPDGTTITPYPTTSTYSLVLSSTGTYKIRLYVYDECPTGIKECYDPAAGTCDIIVIDCVPPICNFTVE